MAHAHRIFRFAEPSPRVVPIKSRRLRPLRIGTGLRRIAVVSAACLLVPSIAIVAVGLNDRVTNAEIIIVPGNTVAPDGTPSPRLRARLDIALELFREQRAPRIFVSGGRGREGFDEAESMSNYLVVNGVPPQAIVKDNLGVDTGATAVNASRFMRANSLKTAIVATQYFHVARTTLALERNGVEVVGTVHARYIEARDAYSILREVVGYAAYYAKWW